MARGKAAEQGEIIARQIKALDLRISGFSFRAIGEKLEVSHQQVYRDIENELERLAKLRDDKTETLRELELQRLDKLYKNLDHWASAGNISAALALVKVGERRSKLLGLDAPAKHEIDWREQAKEAGIGDDDISEEFEKLVNGAAKELTSRGKTPTTD